MGTRASFFINDPRDLDNREWLGCIAYDGYPNKPGVGEYFKKVRGPKGFRKAVLKIAKDRGDFTNPQERSFPFPWRHNLFLTDYTYAWIDGEVMVTFFHRGFVSLLRYMKDEDSFREKYYAEHDILPGNVPAPVTDGPPGPDSIMILGY